MNSEKKWKGLRTTIFWNSPESDLDWTNNDLILLHELVSTLDKWGQSRPAPKRTLGDIVLERLDEAGPQGSKAAAIRDYARAHLQRDFSVKADGGREPDLVLGVSSLRFIRKPRFVDILGSG